MAIPGGSAYMDWLNDTPEAAYFGSLSGIGLPKNQTKYLQTQYDQSQNQYMGALGAQAIAGQMPTVNYMDWIQKWLAPGGGASQEWAAMSPGARGEQQGRFAPPVRWMPYGRSGLGLGGY